MHIFHFFVQELHGVFVGERLGNFTGSFSSQLRWRNFPLNGVIRPCIPGADVSLGFGFFALMVYSQCLGGRFLGVPLRFWNWDAL